MKYDGVRIAEFDNFMLSQDSHTSQEANFKKVIF